MAGPSIAELFDQWAAADEPSIAELFDQWAAAERFARQPCGDDDDETARRCTAADALANQLAAVPAGNLADFARKVLLLIHTGPLPCPQFDDDLQTAMARAVLADAFRLVPALHPPVTEPSSIADCAVKLRRLLRPGCNIGDTELASVRQCIAFLERLAARQHQSLPRAKAGGAKGGRNHG